MDFIEQEAECSDCSDSTVSSNDESNGDRENFIDDREYSDEESSPFANVVRPIDGDLQPRLYDRASVDGRGTDNFKKDKYRAEKFRKTLLCFSEQQRHGESNLFFRLLYMEFIIWTIWINRQQILLLPATLLEETSLKNCLK